MKKKVYFIFTVFVLVLLSSCVTSPKKDNKTIYGIAFDTSHKPLKNLVVELNEELYSETDSQGYFVFYNVQNNQNKISIVSPLFKPFEEDFCVEHETKFLQIRLDEMETYLWEAKEAIEKNKFEKAVFLLKEAIELNPLFEPAYVFLAFLYLNTNDFENLQKMIIESTEKNISLEFLDAYIDLDSLDYLHRKEIDNEDNE